ncbi:exopolysaccharide biosynthesis polyprenyl glycosylphosphotransferase [Vibrio scophthalmi]|uniref:Undecaprenyl phosphate N,N'-diacetylbacillosamine 1-phosphatetransferase n=1 Tax=Vibrio scophthalmi TaxID=45658 RepID=A0A1E3WJK1_9VIBR|nr:exopolysaccharide biosynthesis polyprenyl glycosylphosphotransferase [Vibrio scophthalmi]ODS09956.1 Undecaprenyl phosphate N,N'-diacetylbacillosamine 1-phosphatetransferase [Vibrio scophthalmi]
MKRLIQNSFVCHGLGVIGTVIFIHMITGWRTHLPLTVVNSLWIISTAYICTSLTVPKITNYLLVDRKFYILPVLASIYAVAMAVILLLRLEYSREVLLYGFCCHLIWMYFSAIFRSENYKIKLSAINNFDYSSFHKHHSRLEIRNLTNLNIQNVNSALVVDLHGPLTAEQEKFIADCSINNISVFHSESIREMVEGKVQTLHLSENAIGTLNPNPIYLVLKRAWESTLIAITLPITLPIMFFTAVVIKLESRGPILFIQERIGQGGKAFEIYKFRSMTKKEDGSSDKFATEEQARVTRVGRFIRKVRIDELPQFFNVLKGDMSLIGPRPEQGSFVKQFEQEIPFYGYRHMVKPGITGWAQTVQGYADCTDSTREKLAHDLYYIKHISFWLDMNIVLKTIKTMLTGFGAK